jgi:DNA-binding CsgD family transcriptional regulator
MDLTEAAPNSQLALSANDIDTLFADPRINGAVLNRGGTIVDVSRAWQEFAERNGFDLPNFGVGQNYLSHCAYADPESSRLIKGISQLLSGQIDFLCFVYPCHSPTAQRWFLLLGFPHSKGDLVALLHFNITGFLPALEKAKPLVLTDRFGTALLLTAFLTDQGAAAENTRAQGSAERAGRASERLKTKSHSGPSLSKRQREVLSLIARGKTNREIGHELGITESTVKVHTTAILHALGVRSRTQAIVKALKLAGSQ